MNSNTCNNLGDTERTQDLVWGAQHTHRRTSAAVLVAGQMRVGHVHLTLHEVVPLRNTNRSYAWLVRSAVASHS